MKKHWQYFKYVARHKWYVFLACLEYGLIWRGIKHDWTKFLPSEWFPYVNYFNGKKIPHPTKQILENGKLVPLMIHPPKVKDAFDHAWNHHQKANSHHWQYYLLSPDQPKPNFSEQSYDGGMTESTITTVDTGKDAALVWHHEIKWWKPDWDTVKLLVRDLKNTPIPLKMPLADAQEMVADWIGAGKALGKPNFWDWYAANRDDQFLHPDTRQWVDNEINRLKIRHLNREAKRMAVSNNGNR